MVMKKINFIVFLHAVHQENHYLLLSRKKSSHSAACFYSRFFYETLSMYVNVLSAGRLAVYVNAAFHSGLMCM